MTISFLLCMSTMYLTQNICTAKIFMLANKTPASRQPNICPRPSLRLPSRLYFDYISFTSIPSSSMFQSMEHPVYSTENNSTEHQQHIRNTQDYAKIQGKTGTTGTIKFQLHVFYFLESPLTGNVKRPSVSTNPLVIK